MYTPFMFMEVFIYWVSLAQEKNKTKSYTIPMVLDICFFPFSFHCVSNKRPTGSYELYWIYFSNKLTSYELKQNVKTSYHLQVYGVTALLNSESMGKKAEVPYFSHSIIYSSGTPRQKKIEIRITFAFCWRYISILKDSKNQEFYIFLGAINIYPLGSQSRRKNVWISTSFFMISACFSFFFSLNSPCMWNNKKNPLIINLNVNLILFRWSR